MMIRCARFVALLALVVGVKHCLGERPTATAAEPTSTVDNAARFAREQDRWKTVQGFNYQPSFGRSGVEIWIDKFDGAAVERELGLGRRFFPKMNTVRLWLSHDAFLKDPAQFARNFEQVLQACEKTSTQGDPHAVQQLA
jgi:hypothetical protein